MWQDCNSRGTKVAGLMLARSRYRRPLEHRCRERPSKRRGRGVIPTTTLWTMSTTSQRPKTEKKLRVHKHQEGRSLLIHHKFRIHLRPPWFQCTAILKMEYLQYMDSLAVSLWKFSRKISLHSSYMRLHRLLKVWVALIKTCFKSSSSLKLFQSNTMAT
jgi:hypothetical protein